MADAAEPGPHACRARRWVVDAPDTESARELLTSTYGNMRIETTRQPGGMRLASDVLGPVRFDHVALRMAFRADAEPLRSYVIAQVLSGRVRYDQPGRHHDYRPGEVYFTAQPEQDYTATIDDTEVALAVFDQELLDQVAQAGPGGAGNVRFTGYETVSPGAARVWKATYAHLHERVLASPETMAVPLVAANAARLLVTTALAAFPNTALTDPTSSDRHDAHPRALLRATAFIDAHADRDISAADVAHAARVTIRAVQLAFRRHLDTTPMAYLRRVRLDRARADLRGATPGQRTVTQIAARWGYGRPSVFAARYRDAYGEPPSHTLRRS